MVLLKKLGIPFGSVKFLLSFCKLQRGVKNGPEIKSEFPGVIANYSPSRNVEFFTLIIIACGPAISTFYVGTFMKSPFYSSLQYSMQRLKGTERSGTASHAPSADNSNKYKTNTYAATGNYQEISVHSTKSLVSNNQNNVELEPQKPSQVYPYSTLGEQELGNIRPRP